MRRFVATLGIATFSLAGCSKAPDGADPGPALGNAAAGLAFAYAYSLTLPARAIDDLQEAHAAACEALGPERCRITGIAYDVDAAGDVSASLSANVAAPIARRFGRDAVDAAERAGATLTGIPADDPHERIRAHLRPAAEVVALARSGGITQSMHVAGLALALTELGLWRKSADVFPHP